MSKHFVFACLLGLMVTYAFIIKFIASGNPYYIIGWSAIGYPSLVLFREDNWQKFVQLLKDDSSPVWFNVAFSLTLLFIGFLFGKM